MLRPFSYLTASRLISARTPMRELNMEFAMNESSDGTIQFCQYVGSTTFYSYIRLVHVKDLHEMTGDYLARLADRNVPRDYSGARG